MSQQKIELQIVVNGQPYSVDANVNAPLRTVVNHALSESGNTGQPPQNWDLKLEDGTVLELDKKIEEYSFGAGTTLFLSLRAGAGG